MHVLIEASWPWFIATSLVLIATPGQGILAFAHRDRGGMQS